MSECVEPGSAPEAVIGVFAPTPLALLAFEHRLHPPGRPLLLFLPLLMHFTRHGWGVACRRDKTFTLAFPPRRAAPAAD